MPKIVKTPKISAMRTKTFSTFEVAKILELAPGTVANWIDAGKLPAFSTLGGHRRVKDTDLIGFLKAHSIPVPGELTDRLGTERKVLLVEDDPGFLTIMSKAFKAAKKWKVFTAADGFQAGALVGSVNPDLIILDLMLPDINGFKVCEIIKACNRDAIVIAVTGYDSPEIKARILSAGADAYFVKPFNLKELFARIGALCARLRAG